ncbi:hypothetical protein ACS3QZ_05855 [Shimia sp. W99]
MLQTLTDTRPYAQPLSPIEVSGDRYALPANFVSGLAFLRPFVKPNGMDFEKQVGLLAGKLYVLTTSLVIEYDPGSLELPDRWFSSETIRMLEAFKASPTEVYVDRDDLCFQWRDGQKLFVRLPNLLPGNTHRQMAVDALGHYRHFNQGVEITNAARREIRRRHGGAKLAEDTYLNEQEIVSRMSRDGKTWTLETSPPFLSNADRVMRFDRKAFLDMIRVADEIDFSTSPVCFRHAHGRGVLVERTLGSDIPTFGGADD